ncbi:MAG: HAMP domain-containing histidine kinase [Ruminococcaceae bacterium]|nr:HAMP domain-containing histidine kinase [Oscillospiraceae bacterium]
MKKNLSRRFVSYFFITMLAAGVISAAFSYLLMSRSLERTMRDNQQEIAQSLIGMYSSDAQVLHAGTDSGYEVYSVHRLDAGSPDIAEYIDRLDSGEIIMIDHPILPSVNTYFSVGGMYYEIALFPNSTLVWQLIVSLLTSVLSAVMLGTCISAYSGRRFLRPIRALCTATEQVAQGNFDVRVPTPTNAEMRLLVDNFNQMTKDLAAIETLQKEFTSNVSHEIKTPLASIKGFAALLCQDDVTEEQRREYASIIAEESERLSGLCAAVLRLSKVENMSVLPDRQEYPLDEQLRRIIVMLEPQWSSLDLKLEIDLDEAVICSNAELLSEVWVNLLQNAIRASRSGGSIWVRLINGLDNIAVEIEDEGCGMDEDTQKRIFDKFYQGDKSHSTEGSGLGLPLALRIVRLAQGSIDVHSREGEGTLFRVTLPRD